MPITRAEIAAVLGPIDDSFAAEVIALDPSPAQLAEAWAWIGADEALVNEYRKLPTGKVADLIEILSPPPQDEPTP